MDESQNFSAAPLDVEKILKVLEKHNVEFMIVGGLAAVVYGSTRMTWDIDVLPNQSDENLSNLVTALKELEAGLRISDSKTLPADFDIDSLRRSQIIECRTKYGDLDILKNMLTQDFRRAEFDELAKKSTQTAAYGMSLMLVSLEDMIGSKKAARRPKDLQDLAVLEELQRRKNKE